ncbi:amidohydrolase family protein [Gordonia sp. HY285]|uniref:amidohydrolase family protein n=1 Tax=Gordonia liuliyuniae TaxID=2911517 RepID=UPI001F459B95|nr:amidohydrolase family protein [Gordonia liuliyuniae]MCF8609172.1 amidohydrolase family protein [Gordonia liuliyuniae]
MNRLVIANADVAGVRTDVHLRGGRIDAVGTGYARPSTPTLDAAGCAVLPGLHDHHLHLHALAAHWRSIRCGPPHVTTAIDLAAALASAPGDGWIRGVGYVETVAGHLDADALDELCRNRPTRIQHRSGAMWVLNSTAAHLVDLQNATEPGVERDDSGRATGRVWRADTWLRTRLPDHGPPPLDEVGMHLAAHGITGITDATPDLDGRTFAALTDAAATGALPQRLQLLGVPLHRSGGRNVATGPYKIVIADSDLPDIEQLEDTIQRAHALGRPVAVHCVSVEACWLLVAVFHAVGTVPGDRVEHGAVIPDEAIGTFHDLGLTVVTQPGFLADRGDDYLRRVDPHDLESLYRCRSLLAAGIGLALSSDAPYGPVDPWRIVAAAVDRTAPDGRVVGQSETLTAASALDRLLAPLDDPGGPARTIAVGADADLIVLDRPWAQMLDDPAAVRVRYTLVGSRVVFER